MGTVGQRGLFLRVESVEIGGLVVGEALGDQRETVGLEDEVKRCVV